MEEIWKDVVGYEEYYKVSNWGRVMSFNFMGRVAANGRILVIGNIEGYSYVRLWRNNKYKAPKVHRLVAIAFIPNPENLPEVNHIDGNKLNNNVNNLEWVSRRENNAHSFSMRQHARSSDFIGVFFQKRKRSKLGLWRGRIIVDKQMHELGLFETELEAINAVKLAMEKFGITNRYADFKKTS